MAEMKIKNGPLRLTLTDDRGRVVADLRYPKVKWKKLVIESEDAEFDAVVLSDTRVRLVRRAPPEPDAADDTPRTGEWDPFREFEYGVRDMLTKAGKAVEDFLDDLSEWSGPAWRSAGPHDPEAATTAADADAEAESEAEAEPHSETTSASEEAEEGPKAE